jgi:hypothetical protein
MGSVEREQTRGRRREMDIRREQGGNIDYGVVNEEASEKVEKFRIGEKRETGHLEIALRKRRGGKEQRRKGVEIGIKQLILIFLELLFYV